MFVSSFIVYTFIYFLFKMSVTTDWDGCDRVWPVWLAACGNTIGPFVCIHNGSATGCNKQWYVAKVVKQFPEVRSHINSSAKCLSLLCTAYTFRNTREKTPRRTIISQRKPGQHQKGRSSRRAARESSVNELAIQRKGKESWSARTKKREGGHFNRSFVNKRQWLWPCLVNACFVHRYQWHWACCTMPSTLTGCSVAKPMPIQMCKLCFRGVELRGENASG